MSFDGHGISVWDLKKEIINDNKMGRGADFDFAIYNADTDEGKSRPNPSPAHHPFPHHPPSPLTRHDPTRPDRC